MTLRILKKGPTYRADLKLDPDLEDQINRPLTKEDFAGEYRPLRAVSSDYIAEHILKMQKQK
jgi:hypothetical protein